MSAIYRVRQFVAAAAAWFHPRACEEIQHHLSPAAFDLFQAMPSYDRNHALNVWRTLQQRGEADADLLAAALLHDVGKTVFQAGALRLWHRVAVVLMRAFWPSLLEQLGEDLPGSWRRPFYIQNHHAAFGAELALRAGCSQRTAELIERHEEPDREAADLLLMALQAADAVN
jgi:hypothetical protein